MRKSPTRSFRLLSPRKVRPSSTGKVDPWHPSPEQLRAKLAPRPESRACQSSTSSRSWPSPRHASPEMEDAKRLRLMSWQQMVAVARDTNDRHYAGKIQVQMQNGVALLTRWTKSVGALACFLAQALLRFRYLIVVAVLFVVVVLLESAPLRRTSSWSAGCSPRTSPTSSSPSAPSATRATQGPQLGLPHPGPRQSEMASVLLTDTTHQRVKNAIGLRQ